MTHLGIEHIRAWDGQDSRAEPGVTTVRDQASVAHPCYLRAQVPDDAAHTTTTGCPAEPTLRGQGDALTLQPYDLASAGGLDPGQNDLGVEQGILGLAG